MGMGDLGWGRHKLHQLLSNFVTAEVVSDVTCEGCNRGRDKNLSPIQSKQLKIQQFGKVKKQSVTVNRILIVIFFSYQSVYVFIFQETHGIPVARSRKGKIMYNFRLDCLLQLIRFFKRSS